MLAPPNFWACMGCFETKANTVDRQLLALSRVVKDNILNSCYIGMIVGLVQNKVESGWAT